MPLTLDNQILTEEGWKDYKDIKRKHPGPDGKPTGENDILVCLDITNNTIVKEQFVGELYLSKSNRVIYSIKNDYVDLTVSESHSFPYKFNDNDNIKTDRLVEIMYNMTKNNIDKFYLFHTIDNNINKIEIKKDEIFRNIIDTDIFSFITQKSTFYVRRNNLEFWTSY